MNHQPKIAGLLQALELFLDSLDQHSTALVQILDVEESGRTVPPTVRANYRQQLATVREQREQMRARLAAWWQIIGREDAH